MTSRRSFPNNHGFALVSTFLLTLLLVTLGSATMVFTIFDLKSSANYNTGNQALYTAEAGAQHALGNINALGVLDFNADIAGRWSSVFGTGTRTMSNNQKFSYTVTVVADAASPSDRGSLTATGYAPGQAQRVIRVRLRKGSNGQGYGAIHLAADNVGTNFVGDSFFVDGNNYDMFGVANSSVSAHPGISTRNDTVTNATVNSLTSGQKDDVQGLGFSVSPLTPSVETTGGPSTTDLNRIVNEILAKPGVVTDNTNVYNNGDTRVFGTIATPQITHLTNDNVKVNGSITGAGILICDGGIDISGTIDFVGWIIVRGDTVIATNTANDGTTVLGNATIRGSLWTGDFDVKVGGSASVKFCDQCMTLADQIGGGSNAPRAMQVSSWEEIL